MNIHVIGVGYVGLVTALSFCHYGHQVSCWDINHGTINTLSSGIVHFFEPGVEDLLTQALDRKTITIDHINNLRITQDDELVFICVGTPTSNGQIDLTYVKQAVASVAQKITSSINPSIIIKSTVVPGTTAEIVLHEILNSLIDSSIPVNLGMAPEFLREGSAVEDCLHPDRIVIGFNNKLTQKRLLNAYAPFDAQIVETSLSTAEFSKYANNSILALFISMSNELARVGHLRSDINIDQAFQIVGLDKRWKGSGNVPPIFTYMYPGCGFGGSCFPKDVKALESYASSHGNPTPILSSIISTNSSQPQECLRPIQDWLRSVSSVGILGLSFKPNTDDIRESPAIPIINILSSSHNVHIHDPQVRVHSVLPSMVRPDKVIFAPTVEKLLSSVNLVLLVTPWPQYLNIHELQSSYSNLMLYDCRTALASTNFTDWEYRSYTRAELFLL